MRWTIRCSGRLLRRSRLLTTLEAVGLGLSRRGTGGGSGSREFGASTNPRVLRLTAPYALST